MRIIGNAGQSKGVNRAGNGRLLTQTEKPIARGDAERAELKPSRHRCPHGLLFSVSPRLRVSRFYEPAQTRPAKSAGGAGTRRTLLAHGDAEHAEHAERAELKPSPHRCPHGLLFSAPPRLRVSRFYEPAQTRPANSAGGAGTRRTLLARGDAERAELKSSPHRCPHGLLFSVSPRLGVSQFYEPAQTRPANSASGAGTRRTLLARGDAERAELKSSPHRCPHGLLFSVSPRLRVSRFYEPAQTRPANSASGAGTRRTLPPSAAC